MEQLTLVKLHAYKIGFWWTYSYFYILSLVSDFTISILKNDIFFVDCSYFLIDNFWNRQVKKYYFNALAKTVSLESIVLRYTMLQIACHVKPQCVVRKGNVSITLCLKLDSIIEKIRNQRNDIIETSVQSSHIL